MYAPQRNKYYNGLRKVLKDVYAENRRLVLSFNSNLFHQAHKQTSTVFITQNSLGSTLRVWHHAKNISACVANACNIF
jgi:hypothetical protein